MLRRITKNTQKFHVPPLKNHYFCAILDEKKRLEAIMDIREALTNTFYFTVGAAAVGLEVLSGAAKTLTKKGAEVVNLGKAEFIEFCANSVPKENTENATNEKKASSKVSE